MGQYAPKTFLRQVRGFLVNQCLRRHGIGLDLNLEIIKPAVVDELFTRLMSLPPEQLSLVERDFMAITAMASSGGTAALQRESQRQGHDLTQIFRSARNAYERACWTFLNHPEVFALAACFHEMDGYNQGRWNRRYVGKALCPATGASDLGQLATLLRRSYADEGRGRFCHIDYYQRQDPERHCFFAYPEDYASTDLAYTEEGRLRRQARKSAFEVIFVYQASVGFLEILAPGGQQRKEELASCFCASILGLTDLPPQIRPEVFDLRFLKSPHLRFPTDPEDAIEQVLVREVHVELPECRGWHREIEFVSGTKVRDPSTIHEVMARSIADDHVTLEDIRVVYARFTFVFAEGQDRRAKRLTFDVALPDRCNLKDDVYDHIARKYLARWGCVVDPDAPGVLARVGHPWLRAVQLRRCTDLATRFA